MNWQSFDALNAKQKGDRFEDFCFDLLSELGFIVDRQSFTGNGGTDLGQDLVIQGQDPETGILRPTCVVECKFRYNATIGGPDLWSPLLAVLELNIPCLLIITSSELTGTLKSRMRNISQNSRWRISLRKIEGNHLEAIIKYCPRTLKKYFPEISEAPVEPSTEVKMLPIIADLKAATTIDSSGLRALELTIHNTSPKSCEVQIQVQGIMQNQRLLAFQEKTIRLNVDPHPEGDDVLIQKRHTSNQVVSLSSKPPIVPISHIFVDPFEYIQKITKSINDGATVLVSGKAGSGKSRIIAEVASQFKYSCLIDLSQNSFDLGLIDLILEVIFSMPIGEIRELSGRFIRNYLKHSTELPENALKALSDYIRQIKIEDRGFAEASARLCTEWFDGHLLSIDNIHKLTLFDLEFLRALTRHKKKMYLLLATRSETSDVRQKETLSFIEQHQNSNWHKFTIDSANTYRLLEAYIENAAEDKATIKFLRPWTNVDSIQNFILALKKLKAAGVLKQNFNGKFKVYSLQGAHPNRQKEILKELVELVSTSASPNIVDETLMAASIFGFQFPVSFIEKNVGRDGLKVLDRLEEIEITSALELVSGELWMQFDHETTAELAKQSVRSINALRLHQKVLEYLQEPRRYKAGRDDYRVAEHLKSMGQFMEAAHKYHAHATYQAMRGRYNDGLKTLGDAKEAIDSVDDFIERNRLALEIQIIHDFLDYSLIGSETPDRRWKMLGAFKLALCLSGNEKSGRMAGRYWFFKAHLERDENPNAAEKSIKKSLEIFDISNISDRAESHAWISNFLKRRGIDRFSEAVYHARQALRLTRSDDGGYLRARCLLHAGALFLEKGRPNKTVWWWGRAVESLSGTKNIGVLAFALADFAYIQALVHPTKPETRSTLMQSLTLANQFDLHHISARAAINLANWRYFFDYDETACLQLIIEAQEHIDIIEEKYQQALLDFSCLNFRRLHKELNLTEIQKRLFAFLDVWFEDGTKNIDGDKRISNILEYISTLGDEKAEKFLLKLNWYKKKTPGGFINEHHNSRRQKNWYYIDHESAYATYY